MAQKFNPFKPNSPVYDDMFAGRTKEINGIESALFQAKNGNPNHIMLIGERGIGKTSLLLLANFLSRDDTNYQKNFLTIFITLTEKHNLVDLVIMLKKRIERELDLTNPALSGLKKCWEFISRFEACGVSYKNNGRTTNDSQIIDDFIYSLSETIQKIINPPINKNGLVIIIDEGDKANKELNLGTFLKTVTESLNAKGCNNYLFILAGLPYLRDVLMESHESSLRLFQEFYLSTLSKNEVDVVISNGIKENNKRSTTKLSISRKALDGIYFYSEGYPHFVQQIGFSIFNINKDDKIDDSDVKQGFLKDGGALELIGDRYYKKYYFEMIKTESQRKVLKIMAEKWGDYVSREYIKSKFEGNEATLDSAIKALKEKSIILPKPGVKGEYKLQWTSFAFWIKFSDKKIG
jgi:energy-coupling factor transporter ATP-binding protein EcfA2